jgi:hypothetical protein
MSQVRNGQRTSYVGVLVTTSCGDCQIHFAIPEDFERRARNDDDVWFWCPNGHKLHYSESENSRLKRQVEQAKQTATWAQSRADRARAEADHQAARARGYKGALTKTKKRIGKGVCPCCNRHFANVERHMKTQHPEETE